MAAASGIGSGNGAQNPLLPLDPPPDYDAYTFHEHQPQPGEVVEAVAAPGQQGEPQQSVQVTALQRELADLRQGLASASRQRDDLSRELATCQQSLRTVTENSDWRVNVVRTNEQLWRQELEQQLERLQGEVDRLSGSRIALVNDLSQERFLRETAEEAKGRAERMWASVCTDLDSLRTTSEADVERVRRDTAHETQERVRREMGWRIREAGLSTRAMKCLEAAGIFELSGAAAPSQEPLQDKEWEAQQACATEHSYNYGCAYAEYPSTGYHTNGKEERGAWTRQDRCEGEAAAAAPSPGWWDLPRGEKGENGEARFSLFWTQHLEQAPRRELSSRGWEKFYTTALKPRASGHDGLISDGRLHGLLKVRVVEEPPSPKQVSESVHASSHSGSGRSSSRDKSGSEKS